MKKYQFVHSATLIKRVSVTYKCYEMYAHRGNTVQLLVFSRFLCMQLTLLVTGKNE
jgi:hypothetical protein